MRTKTIATSMLVTLLLGSGVGPVLAEEPSMRKAGDSVGMVLAVQMGCGSGTVPMKRQDKIEALIKTYGNRTEFFYAVAAAIARVSAEIKAQPSLCNYTDLNEAQQ